MARVYVDRDTHQFYRDLTDSKLSGRAPFPTMKDLFMFSFSVGVRNGIRKPLSDRTEVFGTEVFDPENDVPLIIGVYLAETSDLLGLDTSGSREAIAAPALHLAEEYANAGVALARAAYNPHDVEVAFSMLLLDSNG